MSGSKAILLVMGKALLLVCIVGAITFFLHLAYLRSIKQKFELPTNVLPLSAIDDPYHLVKVGNSHAQDGLTFEKYRIKSLPLAGVAQRFSFDLVMLKHHRAQIADGAVIIIDVSPLSFSHRTADRHDGMQYNYFGAVSPFLIPDLKVSEYLLAKVVPFFKVGYAFRTDYADTVRQRIADEEKWEEPSPSPQPTAAIVTKASTTLVTQPKQVIENPDFHVQTIKNELSTPSQERYQHYIDNIAFVFNKWYATDEFGTEYFENNRRDLEKLIAYCLQQNWRPVLITVPVSAELEEALLDDYKQLYLYDQLAQTDLQGAEYIDFTQRQEIITNRSIFRDSDHLNKKGAALLSYVLLQELITRGYLAPEVDGYDYTVVQP